MDVSRPTSTSVTELLCHICAHLGQSQSYNPHNIEIIIRNQILSITSDSY